MKPFLGVQKAARTIRELKVTDLFGNLSGFLVCVGVTSED